MIRPTRVVVYLAALAAMSGRTIAGPKIYSNPEFGIHLAVPNEDLLCPTVKDQHDHGFGMLLGGGSPKDCHEDAHHRSIWLFAFFNVLDDTKHLSASLAWGVMRPEDNANLDQPTCRSPVDRSPQAG
jgi:hypothetical protein